MAITLPIYHYFGNCLAVEHEEQKKCRAGTPYCGSLGTDPQRGFINTTTFCYRILLKKCLDGSKVFIAERWTQPPYSPGRTDYTENLEERIFEGTEETLPQIEEWLNQRYSQLIGNEA